MSKGGSTCNRLKFIRKRLAEQNGIDYKVERCPNSDGCKEGTCPFCEKEADDLMTVLLEKEKRGEKVIWDVSLDEYDPNVLYGDRTELDGNEVVIHGDAKFGEVTIPPIDINPSTLEEIKLRPTMMGRLIDRKKMPDIKDRRVDGMVDAPPFIEPDKDLQGYAPNPNKMFDFPDYKTVDALWFENDKENDFYNESQDSSISSEKPLLEEVSWLKNDSLKPDFSKPFRNPLMGDIAMPEDMDMGLISDVEFAPIDNPDYKFMTVDNSDLMMVRTDPTDLDDDNVDETLLALQNIHHSTGAKFTDTLNAYLREGKDVEKAIEYLTTYGGYEKCNIQKDTPEEKSENAEPRSIPDDPVESNDNPITLEAIKAVRRATSEEMMYCKQMLQKYDGDVDKAIEEINNHPPKRPLMGRVVMDDEKEGK